jgi:ethanolamine permease
MELVPQSEPVSSEPSDHPAQRSNELDGIKEAAENGNAEEDTELPDNSEKFAENSRFLRVANYWDVLAFGICLTSANLSYGAWHFGLILGFWSFFFATLIISTVFFALHFCIAEMISILPFSGGMYGFARVTVGPYLGFIVGCFESMGNILNTMYGMIQLGHYFCFITSTRQKYLPAFWLMFYVIIILNEFMGRKYYFRLMRVTAVLILLIFVFYTAISIPKTHPKKYFNESQAVDQTFFYGAELTIVSLQYAAFIYFALEIIPLVSDEVKNAKKDTPRALIGTLFFVFIFGILIMFLTFTQYPGYPWSYILKIQTPLNSGFENTFPGITERYATAFAFLPLLATVSIYAFGFAKQLKALGTSRLLPAPFAWTISGTNIPYMSLLIGCAIGYSLLIICYTRHEVGPLSVLPSGLYLTGFMFTYVSFIIVLVSYIIFKVKYYNLPREFTSPLGIFGAVYAICGFLLLLYILVKYTIGDFSWAKISGSFAGIITLYYFVYANQRQTFSEEEQKIMFVVYLMQSKSTFHFTMFKIIFFLLFCS